MGGVKIMNNTPLVIDLRSVHKYYKSAAGDYHALNDIDLQIQPGEFVSIIGKSGSGKSTLLNMITGIDRPTQGEVWVNGTAIHDLSENQLAVWRGDSVGIIFQFFQLLPALSLLQNVMLPMELAGKYARNERRDRALQLLRSVDLAGQEHKLPSTVSGGQQQRAAVARALANDPKLIIADEPTGNLDSKSAETIFSLFNQLVADGKTVIVVTHDSSLARRTHRTALITDGEIVNEYIAKAMPTLTPQQLLTVSHRVKPQSYEPGSMILVEGKNSDNFFIISKGTVDIVLPRPNQSDVIALQLGPGKYFGEMEFFHERRNKASIRASLNSAVEVLALSYEMLTDILNTSEPTREALRSAAEQHEKENISKRSVPSKKKAS